MSGGETASGMGRRPGWRVVLVALSAALALPAVAWAQPEDVRLAEAQTTEPPSEEPPPPDYVPPPSYDPDPGYAPDPGYDPNPSYHPDPGYAPDPGYDPNPSYDPDPSYDPNPGDDPDPGYAPDPGYQEYETDEPPPLPVPKRDTVEQQLDDILGDSAYGFCNDPDYRLRRDEKELCELAKHAKGRCPAFEQACKNPLRGAAVSGAGSEDEEKRKRLVVRAPSGLAMLGQILFWFLVAAALGMVIWLIAKNALGGRGQKDDDEPDAEPGDDADADAPVVRRVETDVERLLGRARAAAERGDYDQGVADAWAALLRHLDAGGLVHMHPSSTNGDYVRSLKSDPDLRQAVRGIARDVDRVQFGAQPTTRERFQQVFERVLPIVQRALLLVLLCLPALGATGCLEWEEAEDSSRRGAWDDAPSGHSALIRVLEANGSKVHRRIRRIDEIDPEVDAFVVLHPLDDDEWKRLLEWVSKGGTALVAAELGSAADRLQVHASSAKCGAPLAVAGPYQSFEDVTDVKLYGSGTRTLKLQTSQPWPLLACGDQTYMASRSLGAGSVLILPDSEFLTNASLAAGDNAFFVQWALGVPRRVELVDRWTGAGAASPFAAVAHGKLVPLLLQVLLFLLVLYLWRGWPFGRLVEPRRRARRAFEEHVLALGTQYARAKASRLVLANYADWALDRLRERTQPGARGSLIALATAVAARTGRSEQEVMRVLAEASSAREEEGPRSEVRGRAAGSPDDLATMRRLETLLMETGGKG